MKLLLTFVLIVVSFSRIKTQQTDRIVNGRESSIYEAPFMLSIQTKLKNVHICGASVVNTKWGLSAAHCFKIKGTNKSRLGSIIARSGTTYSDKGGSIHDIVTLRWNSLYDENELIYDIGVFKVKQSFVYSQTLQPIKLPTTNSINLQAGTVYGWGYTVPGSGKASDILRSITLPRVDNTACGKYYGKPNVSPTVICYGHPQGGNTTCQGDSGGPLVNSDGIVIGTVSAGPVPCNKPKGPAMFANVRFFRNWVRKYAN